MIRLNIGLCVSMYVSFICNFCALRLCESMPMYLTGGPFFFNVEYIHCFLYCIVCVVQILSLVCQSSLLGCGSKISACLPYIFQWADITFQLTNATFLKSKLNSLVMIHVSFLVYVKVALLFVLWWCVLFYVVWFGLCFLRLLLCSIVLVYCNL